MLISVSYAQYSYLRQSCPIYNVLYEWLINLCANYSPLDLRVCVCVQYSCAYCNDNYLTILHSVGIACRHVL